MSNPSRAAHCAKYGKPSSAFGARSMNGELANARLACEARGIGFVVDRPVLDLPAEPEAVLAMCLREAITNVVRHSDACRCRVSLAREGSRIRLSVADDGRSGAIREGAGLAPECANGSSRPVGR